MLTVFPAFTCSFYKSFFQELKAGWVLGSRSETQLMCTDCWMELKELFRGPSINSRSEMHLVPFRFLCSENWYHSPSLLSLAITGSKRSVDKISSTAPFLFAAENMRRGGCSHKGQTVISSTAAFHFSLSKGKPHAQMTPKTLCETLGIWESSLLHFSS